MPLPKNRVRALVDTTAISYSGSGLSERIEKSRFVLPLAYRKPLMTSGEGMQKFCLSLHSNEQCLIGFGLHRRALIDDEIAEAVKTARELKLPFDEEEEQLRRHETLYDVNFDAGGRFIFPSYFERVLPLGNRILFRGAGKHFQIWGIDHLLSLDDPKYDIPKKRALSLLDGAEAA